MSKSIVIPVIPFDEDYPEEYGIDVDKMIKLFEKELTKHAGVPVTLDGHWLQLP